MVVYSCQRLLRNNDWPESIPGGKAYDVALICSWLEEFMDQTVSWLSHLCIAGCFGIPSCFVHGKSKNKTNLRIVMKWSMLRLDLHSDVAIASFGVCGSMGFLSRNQIEVEQ